MSLLRNITTGLRALFRKKQVERELDEELAAYLEMEAAEKMRQGMSRKDALRAVRLERGSLEVSKEIVRSAGWESFVEACWRDLRFGLRILRKSPGFTAVAVLTLALGIGASTAMFTVVDGVMLKSLRYPDAQRIVAIHTKWIDSGNEIPLTAGGDLLDLRGAPGSFAAFSYYHGGEFGVQLSHGADFGGIYLVDPNFFDVFEVPPALGRTFTAEDADRAAVISSGFAERNFGSARMALGQSVGIEGKLYEIVGVMPRMFQFPREAQVWVAASPTPNNTNRGGYNYHCIARLRQGVSMQVVDAQLLSLANRLAAAFPDTNRNKTFIALPLQDALAAPVRTTLLLLMAGVGLVLVIACANVANLMLARATSRMSEIAVRAVLGAGRVRLVVQLLSESLVLALAAGLLGVGIAAWGTRALLVVGRRFVPAPLLANTQFDWRVLTFALAVSFLTSILFGIAPAWQATRVDLQAAIKHSETRGLLSGGSSRLRNALVIAQIALSLMLAIGAGLLFRTLLALQRSPMGYRTEGILVTYASAPARTLPEALQDMRTFDDLFARLRRLPGVASAAGAMGLPTGQYDANGEFAIEGKQSLAGDLRNLPHAGFRLASPGYFSTMEIPLLRGRDFNDGDVFDRPFVVIISASLARQYFSGEDAIGHRIQCGLDSSKWMTVVGVVGDVRQYSPAARPEPELYMPMRQHPFSATDMEVVVRAIGDPRALIPAVEKAIHDTDPEIALKFTTMSDMVSDSIGAQRFRTVLTSTFAVLALLLALSGMYAVMNYVTRRRTGEFGLRSALGAQRGNIVALVLRGALKVAGIGVAIGLALSIITARLFESMLFGVKSLDATTYGIVIVIVLPVVVLAAAVPSWRASQVDPMVALRYE